MWLVNSQNYFCSGFLFFLYPPSPAGAGALTSRVSNRYLHCWRFIVYAMVVLLRRPAGAVRLAKPAWPQAEVGNKHKA